MALVGFILFLLILFLMGIPIYVSMIGASMAYLTWIAPADLVTVTHKLMYGLNSFPLLAVPFFLLMGNLMDETGITDRLVDFANVLVGHLRGGLAYVTVVANMLMAGVSGVATSDVSALGGVLIPAMNKEGYPKGFSCAINAASATIGPIIPPSLPMVVYGALASVSVGRLFLGGIIPGIMMGTFLAITAYVMSKRYDIPVATKKPTFVEIMRSAYHSTGPLIIPVIIIGGIISGIFTPTEAGAVAVLTVLILGKFIYKKLTITNFMKGLRSTIGTLGSVMIIISAASAFGMVLTQENVGATLTNIIVSFSSSPSIAMLIIMAVALVLGCFIEVLALLIMLTPIFMPTMISMGVNPVHFGVFLILIIQMGLITPPVGMCMYITTSIAKIDMVTYTKYMWPFLVALLVVILIVMLVPQTVTFIPNLVMGV